MYSTIIFDFFGVFCPDISAAWFKRVAINDPLKAEAFQAIRLEADCGRLTKAQYIQNLSQLTGVVAEEVESGIDAEAAVDSNMIQLVKLLKTSGSRIAVLSNGNHDWTTKIITNKGMAELFEQVIISSDLGFVKPQREIYEKALEILHISADQAIFVDDVPANVTGAEAAGIRSMQFTRADDLKQQFVNIGALTV